MRQKFGTEVQSKSSDPRLPYYQKIRPTAPPPVELPPFDCENAEYVVEFVWAVKNEKEGPVQLMFP